MSAVLGAATSFCFDAYSILLTVDRSKVGVPDASKKWCPRTGYGPEVEIGVEAAAAGRVLSMGRSAYAREVASKRVATAPNATGTDDDVAQV